MANGTVAVVVGSLRKESFSRKVAVAVCEIAKPVLALEIVEIGDLPFYNQDDDAEGKVPEAWARFRGRIKAFDAVLFVTPEYNRSVPGMLKNAIDVGSRPYGQSAWTRKPAAIISVSPGALGAFGANHHLRQSLVFLDMPTLQQPEVYLGQVVQLLGPDGKLTNDTTRALIEKFVAAFSAWIEANTEAVNM